MRTLTVICLLLLAAGATACDPPTQTKESDLGGNPRQGAKLIGQLGCGTCHSIPGIDGANGRVGPPLTTIGDQTILAGVLPNTPENMMRWLKTPQSIVPGNAMPNMELKDNDARDVAAYLYTLR